MNRVQSNHCVIYNTKNEININKLYNADHTSYDLLIENNNFHINKYPISIQLYHLHSISLWKHQFRFSKQNYTKENEFIYYAENYVKELEKLYMNNKAIPLLNDINNMYKQLF